MAGRSFAYISKRGVGVGQIPTTAKSVVFFIYASSKKIRSRIHEHTISLRFLGIILRVIIFEVSIYTMFTLQTSFKLLLLKEGGGGGGRSKIR